MVPCLEQILISGDPQEKFRAHGGPADQTMTFVPAVDRVPAIALGDLDLSCLPRFRVHHLCLTSGKSNQWSKAFVRGLVVIVCAHALVKVQALLHEHRSFHET